MEFKPLFYAYLVLCIIAFLEVFITMKKNSLLKICFLLIISSLFIMNYFSYLSVGNRLQFILVKSMRLVYVCSTLLAIIYLVTPNIPRWIIIFTAFSCFFLIGVRIFNFSEIALEGQHSLSSPVFSVGPEFYSPLPLVRYTGFILVSVAAALVFYYYRRFFMKIDKENMDYRHLTRWIISMVLPFFLLVIFGVMGALHVFQESIAPYLFSLFSCTIIFSILFRPKFLNKSYT